MLVIFSRLEVTPAFLAIDRLGIHRILKHRKGHCINVGVISLQIYIVKSIAGEMVAGIILISRGATPDRGFFVGLDTFCTGKQTTGWNPDCNEWAVIGATGEIGAFERNATLIVEGLKGLLDLRRAFRASTGADRVRIITVVDEETGEETTYQIVGDLEADIKHNRIAVSSPIARALIGSSEGDVALVRAPAGDREYEILSITYR